MARPVRAIDFETYYDAEYSLKEMGTYEYVHSPKFNAYLVGIKGDDGYEYVGDPAKADWSKIRDCTAIAHNVGFDGLVYARLQELGIIPADIQPYEWQDTADMSVYERAPRDLAGASKYLLPDMKVSKSTRKKMKGLTLEQAKAQGLEKELWAYGLQDPTAEEQLWTRHSHLWPEKERLLSKLARESAQRGVHVNKEALMHALIGTGAREFPGWKTKADFVGIEIQVFDALKKLPWVKEGQKPLSMEAIRVYGRSCGVDVPGSLDARDKDAAEWIAKYEGQHEWISAIAQYRRLNTLHKKLTNLKNGLHGDDIFSYQTKYMGAHSGRDSAGDGDERKEGGKFNIKNMYRKELFGVDLRKLIIPRPGKLFLIADYAQIEARAVLWRAGDKNFMEILRKEGNLYQAYAKKQGVYNGSNLKKDNPDLYAHSKVAVLSSGYQCGGAKYRDVAEMVYGIKLTLDQAWDAVYTYRRSFPLVPAYWANHMKCLRLSALAHDPTHEVVLPSGRSLTYYEPQMSKSEKWSKSEIIAMPRRGDKFSKFYGGKLTENEVQAFCRDIMCDGWIACVNAGFDVPFNVYDELVIEVDEADAHKPELHAEIKKLMCESSPWAEGLPLDVEMHVLPYYNK